MAVLPVRNLGSAGVVTDVEPYNLPIQAFSRADNVVFEDGKVARAPVFKSVYKLGGDYQYDTAAFATQAAASGTDEFFVCDRTYNTSKYAYPSFSTTYNATYLIPDSSPSADTVPVTSTTLAEVVYFNKPDRRPIYKLPSETFFRELHPKDASTSAAGVTSSWGSLSDVWTCQSFRSYGDFLLALNTSEGSNSYPARVRWCDPVLNGSAGLTWDASDPTTLAGFNDLVQIEGGIVDGLSLGNQFIIYSKDQVWLMEFVGGQFVFNFRRLFTSAGVINANCIAEVDNNHYVFGQDDIYIHNGTQKESIAKGKVRDFIYKHLDTDKSHAIFVHHDVRFKKIMFCYNSADPNAKFDKATHCNKAAVYSYIEGTWSFMDLPNLTCAGIGNLNSVVGYDVAGAPTYDSLGGTYLDAAGSYARQALFGNRVVRTETVFVLDSTPKAITHAVRPSSGVYSYQSADLTFAAGHNISVGDIITITGLPSPYNIWNGAQTVGNVTGNLIRVGNSNTAALNNITPLANVTAVNNGVSPTTYPVASENSYHGLTHAHLVTMDSIRDPAVVATYEPDMNAVAVLERKGIDLDETGQELRSYKNLKNIYPQMVSSDESQEVNESFVTFDLGAADLPNNTPNYTTTTEFKPSQMYQVNTRASGRYLSYKLTTPDPLTYFSLTGFDADFIATAKR